MDYEKKYKEALERAREWSETKNGYYMPKELCEEIFPELKESEDERIRKALVKLFLDCGDTDIEFCNTGFSYQEIFAWLEKQGEYKSPEEVLKIRQELYQSGYNDGYKHGCEDSKKQSEQKPIDKIQLGKKYKCIASPRYSTFRRGKIYKPVDNFLCSLMNLCYECFEPIEDSKQKLANKTEPKFKVGDWVVTSYGKVNQVIAVDEDGDGFTLDDDTYFSGSWKDGYHFWTIKDAKDGDILQSNNKPFIYNEYLEEGKYPFGYGGINLYGRFGVSNGLLPMTHDEVTPATKEQRDTLFVKMKEAGYEWNEETHELKEIEDEEYNGEDYGIDSLYHAQRILEKTLGSVDGYQTDDGILSHKCAITAVKKLYKQKPTEWSEEDKERLTSCIQLLKTSDGFDTINTKWLKSLKERYTWKPSDEQMDALLFVAQHYNPNVTDKLAWDSIKILELMHHDLKKLKT